MISQNTLNVSQSVSKMSSKIILPLAISILKCVSSFDVHPDCWLGNEEFSVDLICPSYTGTGEIYCCGQAQYRLKLRWWGEFIFFFQHTKRKESFKDTFILPFMGKV